MSAIALHDITSDIVLPETGHAGRSGRGSRGRGHLRVVQPGERHSLQQPVGRPTAQPVAALEPAAARAPGRLVLTRRGRLAITLSVATLLVVAAAALIGMLPAVGAGGHSIVVEPGQTLSEIAVTELPELPMDRAIVQIQLANNMNSLDVQAGTTLQIPQP